MKFISRNYPKNDDINVTEICQKACKVSIHHFFENISTGKIIKDIMDETKLNREELIYKVKIDTNRKEIFFAHPQLAKSIQNWADKGKQNRIEEKIQERLIKELNGVKKATNAGQVDILTDEEIIEVKIIDKWKEGVGQLMIFGVIFPNKKKAITSFWEFS